MAPAPARTVRERKPRDVVVAHAADRAPATVPELLQHIALRSPTRPHLAPEHRTQSAARRLCERQDRRRAASPSRARSPSAARSASDRRRARPGRGTGSACRRMAWRERAALPRRGSAPAAPARRRVARRAGSSGSRTRSARSAFGPNAFPTSRSRRSIVAIVIVSQWSQPPVEGVSKRRERIRVVRVGVEPRVRRAHAADEVDGRDAHGTQPRGAVTPPATLAPGVARWMAAYAGFRSVCV